MFTNRRLFDFYERLTILQRMNWILLIAVFLLSGMETIFVNRTRLKLSALKATNLSSSAPEIAETRATEARHDHGPERNIFMPLIAPRQERVVKAAPIAPIFVPPPPPKIPLSQKASYLRLVGIVPGTPLQAILEDQRTQKSMYMTAGQMIEEIQLEKISSDRVTLFCADERLDLLL